MLQVGDKVWIEKSAIVDIGYLAWHFICAHPYATVKARFASSDDIEGQALYALEWEEPFAGGWNVFGTCKPGQGQQVTSKHLSLDFETSRRVVTVPVTQNLSFSQVHDPNDFGAILDETGTTKNK